MKKSLILILCLLFVFGCELKNGTYSDFYPNGEKSFEKNFSDGVEDGKWSHWDEDGVLIIKGNYKQGHEDGYWVYFFSTGVKKLEFDLTNFTKHIFKICHCYLISVSNCFVNIFSITFY